MEASADIQVSRFWALSNRADPRALPLADRHYNRQKPGTPQFVPPGRCLVLLTADAGALWVTSWPFPEWVKHRWPGAWVNSCFRRESGPRASDLITEAVAVTRWFYGEAPTLGMVTFIDPNKVRNKRDFGRCYLRAGFERDGETEGGLIAIRMRPERMPEAMAPLGYRHQYDLCFATPSGPAVPGPCARQGDSSARGLPMDQEPEPCPLPARESEGK